MLIVGIYGSPRKEGNTDLMLDAFLEGAASRGAEIKRVYVRDLDVKGCLECGHCDKTGACVIKDDMGYVLDLLEEAHRIVVAAPMFFYGVPGQLKLLVDRSQSSYMKHDLARKAGKEDVQERTKRGFFLSAGATKGKRLFDCGVLMAKYFFDALNASYAGDLCFARVEDKGAIHEHPTAIEECRTAGEAFAE
ncbi:MAG: flavodoxin family protein [Syntrophobacteraceae bacterium]